MLMAKLIQMDFIWVLLDITGWMFSIRLMLALFRIRIPGIWLQCALLGTLLITAGKVFVFFHGMHLVAVFQYFVIFLYFRFVLKYSWFYALLIDTVGCIVALIMMKASAMPFIPPGHSSLPRGIRYFAAAGLLCLINWLLAAGLERFRLGFSFIGQADHTIQRRISIKKPMRIIVAVVAAVLIFPPSSNHLVPYLLGIVAVCLFILLRWSIEVEMKE